MTRGSIASRRRLGGINGHPFANREAWRRRSALHDLAFLLQGGSYAARGFLNSVHAELSQMPVATAMKSSLGLIEATRVLRRQALGQVQYNPEAQGRPMSIRSLLTL